MREGRIRYVKYNMLLINILAVVFVAILIYITTNNICNYGIARDFLDRTTTITMKPSLLVITVLFLIGCLILSFVLREFRYYQKRTFVYTSLAIDFMISLLLISVLNFNYNGILLWVFANIIYYVRDKVKIIFMILAMLVYVGTDHELLAIKFRLFSLKDYIEYYSASGQQYLLGFYNVIISLNIIIFIIFCIYVIQEQQGIIEEVHLLYGKLARTNSDLQDANQELKKYADIKEKMGETKERNRLAREIHDTLGHTLTGISAGIDACITTIEQQPDVTKKQLEVIAKVTRDGIGEIRRSVSELRPDALERPALGEAIQTMIQDMISVSGAEITCSCENESLKFDEDEENTIYRIIQESVTNAIRHGKANKIAITLEKEIGDIHIMIKDNGIGCNTMKKGFGITHMQERIHMLQGTIQFDGTDGFLVDAMIPIRWGQEYD